MTDKKNRDEHPFSKLVRPSQHHDRITAKADRSFEEAKVNYLLGVFKLNVRKAGNALRYAQERTVGNTDLTFRAFDEVFQSFPIYLGASRLNGVALHLDKTSMLPALFRDFGSAPFFKAYEAFFDTVGRSDKPVGLVFPRKGLKHGMVIYAADDLEALPLGERETVFCYAGGTKKKRLWLFVRSFQRTLEAIHNKGHGWRPDESE